MRSIEYGGGEPEAQILPPLDEDPDEADLRAAVDQAHAWQHLDEDECRRVIRGEMVLAQRRRRGFSEWLEIGEAIEFLQREVMFRSGATNHMGRRYNKWWKQLAPPQLRALSPSDRSNAVWLWINRQAVQRWWDALAAEEHQTAGTSGATRLSSRKSSSAPEGSRSAIRRAMNRIVHRPIPKLPRATGSAMRRHSMRRGTS